MCRHGKPHAHTEPDKDGGGSYRKEEEVTGKGSVVNTGFFLWGSHTSTGCENSSHKPLLHRPSNYVQVKISVIILSKLCFSHRCDSAKLTHSDILMRAVPKRGLKKRPGPFWNVVLQTTSLSIVVLTLLRLESALPLTRGFHYLWFYFEIVKLTK